MLAQKWLEREEKRVLAWGARGVRRWGWSEGFHTWRGGLARFELPLCSNQGAARLSDQFAQTQSGKERGNSEA